MLLSWTSRALVAGSVCWAILGSVGACSEPEPETTEAAKEETIVVPASASATTDLGVTEWHVTAGESAAFSVVGVDARGASVAEMTLHVEERGPDARTMTLEVGGAEPAKLRVDIDGEAATRTGDDLEAKPRATMVVTHAITDIQAFDAGGLTNGGQLTSGAGTLTPKNLVETNKKVTDGPKCLIDSQGNKCSGQVWQAVGAGGAAALLCFATPLTGGAAIAGCGFGLAAFYGSVQSMKDTGCTRRPCPK